ncbi:hypothetical protein NST33_18090 [Paenibacillus sp. FSL L8-0435]|uniref:hypothetical protein n=1 Tax=Paenibacillus sp. FSL L8-0435 TaxID=2954618 RepID=UPI0030DAF03F
MPEVSINKNGGFKPIRVVMSGDLVLIDNDPFIATGYNKLRLISLLDGMPWCDDEMSEGTTEKGLMKYVNDGNEEGLYVAELIKSNEYRIIIEMK